MANSVSIHVDENPELGQQLVALKEDICRKIDNLVHTGGKSQTAIAKGQKANFVLIMWSLFKKEIFVKANHADPEETINSFKNMMIGLGPYFNEDFKDVDQLLQNVLEKDDCTGIYYDLIDKVSKRVAERKNKRKAINITLDAEKLPKEK